MLVLLRALLAATPFEKQGVAKARQESN